jgi:hypothetical protein
VFFAVVVELPVYRCEGAALRGLDSGGSPESAPSFVSSFAPSFTPLIADSVKRSSRPRSALGDELEAGGDIDA